MACMTQQVSNHQITTAVAPLSGMTLSPPAQETLKSHLNHLLNSREPPKTLCPSEVARALSLAELQAAGAPSWRDLMPAIRNIVAQMRDQGKLEVLQKGEVLDGDLGKGLAGVSGPIRLRRKE